MEYTLEELLITGWFVHIFRNTVFLCFRYPGGFSTGFTPPITMTNIEYILMIIISTANRERG